MSKHVLAQLNIAKMRYTIDAPQMSDFVDNLDRINTLAEQAPGFVWRYITDDADAHIFAADILVNFSTWKDIESLHHYVFNTDHTAIMKRRKEWFDRIDTHSVMWWHDNQAPPTLAEARRRITLLSEQGPTAQAFTFKKRFENPDIG
ncbi:MAG: DUF3291 domain-containing protein [Pseudomonadota bacterium]